MSNKFSEDLPLLEDKPPQNQKTFWDVWGKYMIFLAIFAIFSLTILILTLTLPVKSWLEAVHNWIMDHKVEGGLIYFCIFIVLSICCFPGSILEVFGCFVFGAWAGFGIHVVANMVSASICYFLGRRLLRETLEDTMRHSRNLFIFSKSLQTSPWRTTLLIRFLFIPTGFKNYLLGVFEHVTYLIFFVCTLVSVLVYSAIFAAIGGLSKNLADVFAGGHSGLEMVVMALGLVALILLIVFLYYVSQRVMREMEQEAEREEGEARPEIVV